MNIAVYSGSFNPFHKGHLTVVRYMLEHCAFDKVYLIVSPQNPFKDSSIADSGDMRLRSVNEAIERNGLATYVLVDDIEFGMPLPSYTVRTLDALQAREPENRFSLIVGGDNLHTMLSWHEGERIMTQYGIVVYPREGYNLVRDCRVLREKHHNAERIFSDSPEFRHKPLRIKLLRDAPLIDISSSQIREMVSRGEDVSHLLA